MSTNKEIRPKRNVSHVSQIALPNIGASTPSPVTNAVSLERNLEPDGL